MDPQQAPQFTNLSEEFAPEKVPVGWPWRLLLSFGLIFALSIFAYLGMVFGYRTNLEARGKAADANIEQLSNQVTEQDQNRFVAFYSQVVNLKTVLEKHVFPSNIFTFLEKATLPQVAYADASINIKDGGIELHAETDTLDSVAAQISIMNKRPEVDKVTLKDISFSEKGVSFTMMITPQADFLKKPTL